MLVLFHYHRYLCDFVVNSYDDQPPSPNQNEVLYSRPYPRQSSSSQNVNQSAMQNLPPPAPHIQPDNRVCVKLNFYIQSHTLLLLVASVCG